MPGAFMTGDTFLEVASALARTDPQNHAQFLEAVEVVKRYVRAKMKKGKGKEVSGPKGKLEALEVRYARLGYQDIFYLARLQLALPPSSIQLPRPSSPVCRTLMRAGYPLPPEYQIKEEQPQAASDTASIARSGSVARSEHLLTDAERGASRGRDPSPRLLGQRPSLPAGPSTASIPVLRGLGIGSSGSSLSVTTSAVPSPALPSPRPTPTAAAVPIPVRQDEGRDHFDFASTLMSPTRSIPLPSAVQVNVLPSAPLPIQSSALKRGPSNDSVASGSTAPSRRTTQRVASGNEGDVKRLLEARIKALQSALDSLDVDGVPESAPMSRPDSASASAARRDLPAPSPPPTMALPPTPELRIRRQDLRVRNPTHGQEGDIRPSETSPIARSNSLLKRIPSSSRVQTSPRSVTSARQPDSPSLMFDLDPEVAHDPFAASGPGAAVAAAGRVPGGHAYIRRQDLTSKGIERGATPPPTYEAEVMGQAL